LTGKVITIGEPVAVVVEAIGTGLVRPLADGDVVIPRAIPVAAIHESVAIVVDSVRTGRVVTLAVGPAGTGGPSNSLAIPVLAVPVSIAIVVDPVSTLRLIGTDRHPRIEAARVIVAVDIAVVVVVLFVGAGLVRQFFVSTNGHAQCVQTGAVVTIRLPVAVVVHPVRAELVGILLAQPIEARTLTWL
jgi:hypothetical protein